MVNLLLNIFKVIFRIQYCSPCCSQPCFGVLFFALKVGYRLAQLITATMELLNLSDDMLTISSYLQDVLEGVNNAAALCATNNAISFTNLDSPMLTAMLYVVFLSVTVMFSSFSSLRFGCTRDDVVAFIFHYFASSGGSGSGIQ